MSKSKCLKVKQNTYVYRVGVSDTSIKPHIEGLEPKF